MFIGAGVTIIYLEKTYSKEWRKEAPVDILGLDE